MPANLPLEGEMSGRTEGGAKGQKTIHLCVADMPHPRHARFSYRLAIDQSGEDGRPQARSSSNYVRPCGRPSGDFWLSGRDVSQLPAKRIVVGLGSTPPAPPIGWRRGYS
jgi:hypothetical protein